MKYEPCAYCGGKPKVYKDEDGEWNLDHDCFRLSGIAFMAGDCRSDVVTAWNKRNTEDREKKAKASGDAGNTESKPLHET